MRGHKCSAALGTNREPERAHALGPAIICASFANACSTLSPVFADVNIQGAPWDSAALLMSASFTAICSRRSALFARYSIGMWPVTFTTAATHSSRSSSVSFRVTSHTARTPWAPWKYASFSNSRNPFSPMMSQIVMSMSVPPFGPSTLISFFETFAPNVEMYRSSNWSWMNRRIRHVLPTAPSPTRQILTFIRWRSMEVPRRVASRSRSSDYKGIAQRLSDEITRTLRLEARRGSLIAAVRDCVSKDLERFVDAIAGLRRGHEVLRVVDRAHPREFLLAHDEALLQIELVSQEDDGDVAHLLPDHLHPVVQVVERILAGHVANRDHAVGALEVRVAEERPEPFLSHDVPHHHVEARVRASPHHVDRLLRDLRPDGRDVPVLERILHVSLDEGRLSDGDVADQAHFHLDVLLADQRGNRHQRRQPGADLCTVRMRVSSLISIIGRRYAPGESRSHPVRSYSLAASANRQQEEFW